MNLKRMKINARCPRVWGFFIIVSGLLPPVGAAAQNRELADYVDPLIGTDKSSHPTMWESRGATFPGVLRPFGLVQITPNGYQYARERINSFSFLNHSSGWSSAGAFNLMPFTGGLPLHGSAFSHRQEKARPYYYQVGLTDFGINAEFTATAHAGLCRFTFPASDASGLYLSDASDLELTDSNRIRGRVGGYYFIAVFSRPPQSAGYAFPGSGNQAYQVRFSTRAEEQILLRIGFSLSSYAGASANLAKEMPGWGFEQLSQETKKIWNDALGRIEIQTPDETKKTIFYTALYHSLFMPVLLSDAGGPENRYSGIFPWDTYRSEHPLIGLLDPEREGNMISSELAVYDRTGWLPTGNMMGNHNIQVILDGYVKGIRNFDTDKACAAICKSLLDSPYARRQMADFVRHGYVPANITSSVTHSLEFAYDNWAAARFLEVSGHKDAYRKAYDTLLARAGNYRNSFDPADGFMEARTTTGGWTAGGYCEGTRWTYSWYVPHDVQGLINLMGGKTIFSSRLGQCFEEGHYVHDNEPPLHYAYLFNYAGQPWKTQEWARKITETRYSADPGGIPGNDDLGALSSWFVFSAMGFYPVTPGEPQYEIGSPLFEKTSIRLSNGKHFTIIARSVSEKNKYIRSCTLDGIPYNKSWISQDDIGQGKTLVLEMAPEPERGWGSQPGSAPYSMTAGSPAFIFGKPVLSKKIAKAGEAIALSVWVKNKAAAGGMVQIPVRVDGKPVQTVSALLGAGEYRQLHDTIILYSQGKHRVTIPGSAPLEAEILRTAPAFVYRDLETPLPPLIKQGDSITISAKIKNTGSYTGTASIPLRVDGQQIKTRTITLRAGEEKEVAFSYIPGKTNRCYIGLGGLEPVLIRVLDPAEQTADNEAFLQSLGAKLVLHFDEGPGLTIPDHSGNGNNGLVHGQLNWVNGLYGRAVQMDATQGNYISLSKDSILNADTEGHALTLMAWVYPEEEENFSDIISQGDWNSLQIKGSNQMINFYAEGWEGHEAMAAVPRNWNRHWHHLAGVFNGTEYKLYVDGRLLETKKAEPRNPRGETGLGNYSNAPWNIGRNASSQDRRFRGCIDDVMIFRKALTQQQLTNLMLHLY